MPSTWARALPFPPSLTDALLEAVVIVVLLLLQEDGHQGLQRGVYQQRVRNQLRDPNHHLAVLRGDHIFSDSMGQVVIVSLP